MLMSKCWPKLRYGGTLAGGFGNPSALNPQMRTAVLAFAEVEHRQPLLGLDPSTQGLWLLRK